jgi:hypothetical protein
VVALPAALEPGTHHVVASTRDDLGRPTFISNTVTVVPPDLVAQPEVTTTTSTTALGGATTDERPAVDSATSADVRRAAITGYVFGLLTGAAFIIGLLAGAVAMYLFMRRRTA